MPIGQSKAMWQCKLYNLVDNLRTNASDVTWLPRNQNMHMWMKYKTDFKKYWTSDVDKYKSISVEIKRSERADFVNCVLILVSSWRGWRCSCTPLTPSSGTWSPSSSLPKMTPFITRLGFWARALCSHQGGHVLNLHHPRHHGSDPTQRSHSIPISIPF